MSTAKFDTLSNLAGTQTVPVATVAQGSAKAWVNFNGTGTVAIRASFNVSSITDNGTGDYTVNFTSAMPDADFVVSGTSGASAAQTGLVGILVNDTFKSSSSVRVRTSTNTGVYDAVVADVAIFR